MILANSLKKLVIPFSILTALTLFFSCHKNPGVFIPMDNQGDLSTKVTSAIVSGFVTNENDIAVQSASVEIGGLTTTTDKYGYFEIRNVQVVQNAATVTISKTGYFKAVKTYIATQGKSSFFRIKLLPKLTIGNINSTTGGNVTASGLTLTLPANAVINTSTNAAYTGTVTVAAQLLSAVDPNLNRIMPGDLRGLTTDNNMRILTTYGMVAVELTGSAGQLLQMAAGKKATLVIPIPAALQAGAPASIPLWYFNESNGLWKEEGSAVKTGNTYVGEVSHFSYWNYDVPSNYVKFNCTLVNQNGQGIQNAMVKISVVGKSAAGSGYTDSAGYTGGAVPNNSQLQMEVFSNTACTNIIYTKTFSTTDADIPLGTITINTQNYQANVSGTATNCSNTPLASGYVILQVGNQNYRYYVNNGIFNFNTILCTTPTNVTIFAEDVTNLQQGNSINFSLNTGNNSVGNIKACGITTQQFVNYTINGTPYNYTAPADSFSYTTQSPYIILRGETISLPRTGSTLYINNANIAVGSNQQLVLFSPSQVSDSMTITTPIFVNITEYGAVGQFVAGSFTGAFRGGSPANTIYNVTYNFRIRRR